MVHQLLYWHQLGAVPASACHFCCTSVSSIKQPPLSSELWFNWLCSVNDLVWFLTQFMSQDQTKAQAGIFSALLSSPKLTLSLTMLSCSSISRADGSWASSKLHTTGRSEVDVPDEQSWMAALGSCMQYSGLRAVLPGRWLISCRPALQPYPMMCCVSSCFVKDGPGRAKWLYWMFAAVGSVIARSSRVSFCLDVLGCKL